MHLSNQSISFIYLIHLSIYLSIYLYRASVLKSVYLYLSTASTSHRRATIPNCSREHSSCSTLSALLKHSNVIVSPPLHHQICTSSKRASRPFTTSLQKHVIICNHCILYPRDIFIISPSCQHFW